MILVTNIANIFADVILYWYSNAYSPKNEVMCLEFDAESLVEFKTFVQLLWTFEIPIAR